MGDRSTIAILDVDGKVESISTYWSGYPSANGVLLYTKYNDLYLAKGLISLGYIYQLTENINQPKGIEHTIEKPIKGITVLYARDGKRNLRIDKFNSLEEYIKDENLQATNYIYYAKKKEWFCIDRLTKKITKLTKILLQDERVDESIKEIIKSEKLKNKIENKDSLVKEKKLKL